MPPENTPLRFLFKTVIGGLALVGLVVGTGVFLTPPRQAPLSGVANTPLGDGTILSIPQVTVGSSHNWTLPDARSLLDMWSGEHAPGPFGLNVSPAKVLIWVVRHDGKTAHARQWPALHHARLTVGADKLGALRGAVLRDERTSPKERRFPPLTTHTFTLPVSREFRTPPANPLADHVYAFEFPLIPAGRGPWTLELLGEPADQEQPLPVLAKLTVPEPAGLHPPPAWKSLPLPASQTSGPHTLVLTKLQSGGYSDNSRDPFSKRYQFTPITELLVAGQPQPGNLLRQGPLVDSAGNTYENGYSHGVGLWFGPHKLAVTVRIPTPEPLLAESHADSPQVAISPENTALPLTNRVALRHKRIQVRLLASGGRGTVDHPDPTPNANIAWGYFSDLYDSATQRREKFEIARGTGTAFTRGSTPAHKMTVKGRLPHVIYEADGLSSDEWLGVDKVVDDQNRHVKFVDLLHHGTRIVLMNPEPDATSLRLSFEIRDSLTTEFVVDPPQPPLPQSQE